MFFFMTTNKKRQCYVFFRTFMSMRFLSLLPLDDDAECTQIRSASSTGVVLAQWLALLPHSHKVPGSNPVGVCLSISLCGACLSLLVWSLPVSLSPCGACLSLSPRVESVRLSPHVHLLLLYMQRSFCVEYAMTNKEMNRLNVTPNRTFIRIHLII